MASNLLGRATCPECDFASAHIKIKTDKENAKPYRHCPECGAQYFPRSEDQANKLREKIRAQKIDAVKPPEKVEVCEQTTIQPEDKPAPKYKTVFGVKRLVGEVTA